MWSDTLLAAERAHLIRVLIWAATSVTVGTAMLAFITVRRVIAPILHQFATQALAWGLLELGFVLASWRALGMRDVSAATRLDRSTWLYTGLDVGAVGVGVTLAVTAWVYGRRLAVVGAGLGVVVQGLGLLLLDLTFASVLARLV